MPAPIRWSDDDDRRLMLVLETPGINHRVAAELLQVSKSFVQRRAVILQMRTLATACSADRNAAGEDPLPPLHPISWGALQTG